MFRTVALASALVLFGALAPIKAAPASSAAIDPQAMAVLTRSQKAMLGLRSYQAECDTTLTYPPKADKPGHTRRETSLLKAVKPNRMWYVQRALKQDPASGTWAIDPQDPGIVFVCDGKNDWKQFGNSYREDHDTGPAFLHTVLEPWGGFYHTGDSPAAWVQSAQKDGGLLELRREGREAVSGVLCDKVFDHLRSQYGGETQEYRETWFISRDGLVRRSTQTLAFDGKPGYTRDAVLRRVVLNRPVVAQTFTYAPPKGVELETTRAQNQPKLLAVGTTAPDFTASDKDNKPVKPSDFRGKVLVLDFWASWCPPCRASMPHSQEVTQKLQAEGLPVVLLAVDNSEDRDAFRAWVGKNSSALSALAFAYVPQTTNVLGTLYHVSGIPTQYVIDRNGVIRASFVGFGGPTGDLEKAVREALKQP